MIVGKHIILDLFEISTETFKKIYKINFDNFNNFISDTLKNNGATLLKYNVNFFDDVGAFTVLYLLSESHLSIHTWPEHNYISIDIFTCGNSNTQEIANELKKYFTPNKLTEQILYRGYALQVNYDKNIDLHNS